MRIEVLIDVKAVLGEGPLWDVDEQRLYFIDSFGCNVFRCTADGGEVRAWDVPAKIGSMALRRQGGAVLSLANGFHFLDFKTGECQLIVDPEPDKPDNRINDGKVDKRGRFVAGSMDTMEEGPEWRALSPRPRALAPQARRRHHRLQRSVLESRRAHLLFRRQLVGRNLGLRLRPRHGRRLQQAHVLQNRSFAGRRRRRLHGRRGGMPVERAGLRRQSHPVYAKRKSRPRYRHAGKEGDECDVRRPGPRCPLRDVDGQAAPATLSR